MDPIVSVLLFLFGALVGAGVALVFMKKAAGDAQARVRAEGETEKALLSQSLERAQSELAQARTDLAAKGAEAADAALRLRESETRREDESRAAAEKLAVLDRAEKQLR